MPLYIVLHNQGFGGTQHHGIIEMTVDEAAKHLGDDGTGFLMPADPANPAFTAVHAVALKVHLDRVAADKLAADIESKAKAASDKQSAADDKSAKAVAKKVEDEAEALRKKDVNAILSGKPSTDDAPQKTEATPQSDQESKESNLS